MSWKKCLEGNWSCDSSSGTEITELWKGEGGSVSRHNAHAILKAREREGKSVC